VLRQAAGQEGANVELPRGVEAVWDLDKAFREKTPTQERICINGLWRWQPAEGTADAVPADRWGYFKVPGCWPGITDYMQKDCQTLYAHPSWKGVRLDEVTAAWYQREITMPAEWTGRRITVHAAYLNSFAAVYIDGQKTGEIRFPAGEVDLTPACRPGGKHVLSMLVVAMPLRGVMLSYSDTTGAKEVRGAVERRGLCGDVYLVGTPAGARIGDVKADTSVRTWEITFEARLEGLAPEGQYALRAQVMDNGRTVGEFTGPPFKGGDVQDGRMAFTEKWKPEKLWDLHTPQNMYGLNLSLLDGTGKVLDAAQPVRFGFREFRIDGRDFYLNGTRIFLSAVPLNNAQIGAALANYQAVRETLERLKSFGVNFVYTHNYGCEPGSHLSFEEALRAADDEGMLVALSQPHFGHYDWQAPDADQNNGYARHAEFYVHVAGNHPSVVSYAMSHNATGYEDDMSPDAIDGTQDPRPDWAKNSIKPALRAEAIVKRMDPNRIVYHHSSGNLSAMYTLNFYVNFTPIQELSDWFEHWASAGVKPLFTCEYGVPCTWDWTMYRGWYRGGRTFGSAQVPWEFCLAEWNSQFLGDQAFRISEMEKANLRWEAKRFRSGSLWHRWDYPFEVGAPFDEQYPVFAMYIADNYRAFRTLGVSATNVWEYGHYWKLRDGVNKGRREFKVDWERLQRPGLSADYLEGPFEWMDVSYERSDWVPTVAAQALICNSMPLLAYIGGKPAAFTSKDHNFYPGETVEKQLIIINNSRQTVTCDCSWSLALPEPAAGRKQVSVETGQQARVPVSLALPANTRPGRYELIATVRFSNGETQKDSFAIDVLPRPAALQAGAKVALFDPKGETGKLLSTMGFQCQPVDAGADLSAYDTLIVGKAALTVDGPAPDIARVRDGLRVIMFEQTSDVLEKRFGFRVEEYGLRWVFKRVPDHPLLTDIGEENLWNWRGEATILPPRLKYGTRPYYGSTVNWCDIPVTRVYRAGNRGNVASVLIEKPARGDFMPILDGGYSIQFSPLMEYREGRGMVLFCQMDVTGRTESDPAAETLVRNILQYAAAWKPAPRRNALYVGGPAGKRHLERAGISPGTYEGGGLPADQVLIVGAGGGRKLAGDAAAVADFLRAGGNLLALGLDEQEANTFLPVKVSMRKAEHIAAYFEPFGMNSLLEGVSPADVHNRDPRDLPLVSGGATVIGDGVLAEAQNANVVFCQLAPYDITSAQGAVASFVVNSEDAVDGQQSALVTMGTTTEQGGQFGQQVKVTPQVGKTYTFAALVKGVGGPVLAHLEVERAGSPWDRAAKGDNVPVSEGEWTELHITFKAEKPFAEGWQAYIACAQDGGRFRADILRLYEGDYAPWRAPAQGVPVTGPQAAPAAQGPGGPPNLLFNASFETGPEPWWFMYGEQYNLRRTYRRASFLVTRLLANMGAGGSTPLLDRFHNPVDAAKAEKRWLDGFYMDVPEEWDDPYRFFCW
jgi:hypothetical protein